ncbi:Putative glycoside hydrolase [Sphingobacterium spiritivorum]|uniref:Glycoside hydrolase n=1 Tax=Sphingobacterium spiritivorum TaxID=258 RepID=A0A380BBF5_SPHSI|nr:PCMD domain-containing protein [Sphingobacterium spiritivorum]SUI98098.1 Putative glycoside hydrolase [Sphingobacterium spiritivorum]
MLNKIVTISIAVSMFLLNSCIKDEPLNMEADITAVYLDQGNLVTEPLITNNSVTLYVKPKEAGSPDYKLKFDLSPGATITTEVDSVKNFVKPVTYTVTSQDKQFTKSYLVSIVEITEGFVPSEFGFENVRVDPEGKYHIFYDIMNGQSFDNWSSGNLGFSITLSITPGSVKAPESYPTYATAASKSGKYAAYMETKLTGAFGAAFNKPIAAGNLFIGSFDTDDMFANPLQATHFGLPFGKIPVALEGYYKFTPGKQVTDLNLKPVNTQDSCDIYAVFYNREELFKETGKSYLDGTNVLTSKSVVAKAQLQNGGATTADGYTKFSIPFNYIRSYNENDVSQLKYGIALVMSSSKYGDIFQGAVGSVLIVDDLQITTK